jgi:hypothetical protein
MNQKTKIAYLVVIVLSLAMGLTSLVAVAKNSNSKSNSSSKSSHSQGKSQSVNLKNYEKADKAKGTTNAQLHKKKTDEVVENLEQVVTTEESAGNTEISDQIEQVAQEQEQVQEQTTEAIEKIENRGKVKTFLVGTDYKNLGQLRSELVHNRNQIRKLTQALNQAPVGTDTALIEAQLATLMQERERIKTIITNNESSFSLFGWVLRFLTNYEMTPINEQEEDDLTEEVEDAIDNASDETTDATIPDAATTETTVTQ